MILKRIARYTIPLIVVIIIELVDVKHFDIITKPPLEILRWIIDGTVGKGNYYYPVMMQLVFLFPVIYFILDRKKEKGLVICLALNALYELLAWAYNMNTDCYRLLPFRYIFLVAIGVYALKGYRLKLSVAIIMTAVGALFITMIAYMGYETKIINKSWSSTSFIASMFIAPVMIWVLQKVKIRFKPLEVVGKASYHIFLVQMVYYLGYFYHCRTEYQIGYYIYWLVL